MDGRAITLIVLRGCAIFTMFIGPDALVYYTCFVVLLMFSLMRVAMRDNKENGDNQN